MEIKVLGSGCSKCNKLYKMIEDIISEENLTADIEKVEGVKEIMSFGVMGTPGLVINGEVKFSGRLPSKKEIKKIILK